MAAPINSLVEKAFVALINVAVLYLWSPYLCRFLLVVYMSKKYMELCSATSDSSTSSSLSTSHAEDLPVSLSSSHAGVLPVALSTPHAEDLPVVDVVMSGKDPKHVGGTRAAPSHTKTHDRIPSTDSKLPLAPSPSPTAEDTDQIKPLHLNTRQELEDIFRIMSPYFEGKESEQNWTHREESVIKLRSITKGNAPTEHTTTYLAGVKGLLDGIVKTTNSLRTTVSTNGCHLVRDIANAAGPGLDPMVEILLQNLIRLCAATKKISHQNGKITVDTIFTYATYNVRLVQHIWNACQDKNVQPRTFAAEWLKTIIARHGHHKHVLEHGGLDLIEKCIKKGLTDANAGVRTSMRPTYWAFWRVWPDKAEAIMSSLELKQQDQLRGDAANPTPVTLTASKKAPPPRATTSRPSLKETMAAKKRSAPAGKDLPETSAATTKAPTGSLSSAPRRGGGKKGSSQSLAALGRSGCVSCS